MDQQALIKKLLAQTRSEGECLVWTGGTNAYGYGRVKLEGRQITVTRLIYELHHGPIHSWILVCHRCDNPPCINLDHLFLGTHAENIKDAQEKGRIHRKGKRVAYGRGGARNGGAKLTEEQAKQILVEHRTTGATFESLAAQYDIGVNAVRMLCNGKRWKYLSLVLAPNQAFPTETGDKA